MIHKAKGIVFRFVKFRETSIIVTIFTDLFGLQSYIVNGVRSSNNKSSKIALFQPLTLLDMEVYHREQANIQRIKEMRCLYPFTTIPTNIKKSSMAIFINEMVNKTVREESHAQEIFEFISHSLMTLDQMESGVENFHLIFLLKLSRFLGFGAHSKQELLGSQMADVNIEEILGLMLECEYTSPLSMSNQERRIVMQLLLKFYAEHVENLGEIRSIQVLREVLL